MTSPALHIEQSNGGIYYVMLVPVDGQIMDAVENIIIDVAPINTCISYELPATGGMGITLHVLCGMLLVSAPLVYGLSLRRKCERRSQ